MDTFSEKKKFVGSSINKRCHLLTLMNFFLIVIKASRTWSVFSLSKRLIAIPNEVICGPFFCGGGFPLDDAIFTFSAGLVFTVLCKIENLTATSHHN